MHTTVELTGRRTAATWVAATGAFLLVAAAGVFVSVRWDEIPEAAKLGLVLAITAVALAGGRVARRSLPATGDVLFHLGAFLLPIDLAAISVRLDSSWSELLLAEGLLTAAGIGALALWSRSVVLRWASTAGFVVLAAGIGAVSAVPAPVALVVFALAAAAMADRRGETVAVWWAAIAGLAPAIAGVGASAMDASDRLVGGGTLNDLGFTVGAQTATAWTVGAVAAVLLGRAARRREDVALAFLAVATLALGVATSLAAGDVAPGLSLTTLAGAFLAVEVVALVARRDEFWSGPLAVVAILTEALAALVIALLTLVVALLAALSDPDGGSVATGIALGVAAVAWLAADLRRQPASSLTVSFALLRGGGRPFPNVAFALTAVSATAAATFAAVPIVLTAVAAALLLVLTGRPLGHLAAATAVVFATAMTPDAGAAILAAVAVCTYAAVLRARVSSELGLVLATVATTGAVIGGMTWHPIAVVPACWAIGVALDVRGGRLGDVARVGLLVPLLRLDEPVAVGAVLAALLVDAFVFARRDLVNVAAVVVQLFGISMLAANGVADPQIGLALCVAAVVWAGLASVVDAPWRQPFVVAAAAGSVAGLWLAAGDGVALSDALIVTGGLGVAAGILSGRDWAGHLGGVAVTAGVFGHLALTGVATAEPYVVPVAVHLAAAGWIRRRHVPTSSWTAYVPSIVLLGGTALLERLDGGPEWHALVVAGVGTAAVAIGGWHRLAGPLLTGTALLVAITLHESLGALAGVPTWTWLAIAGSTLLATGVALERTDSSPVDATRRLVDVIADRFE